MSRSGTAILFCLLALQVNNSNAADIGTQCDWRYLPGTDGQLHSLSDHKKARLVVVAFMCNKCPCVKGYETRFNDFARQYAKVGVKFVGINCSIGPVENLNAMKQRAASGRYGFEYLRDSSQQVGRKLGASSTPHVFILNENRQVVYSGAFDDNRDVRLVKRKFVIDAVNALIYGRPVPVAKTRNFGCAITYSR